MNRKHCYAVIAISVATALASGVRAESAPPPMVDPWVPPALRKASPATPSHGESLRAQVERKLRDSFDAADIERSGSVTRDQARAAGLGFVAKNFDRIDARNSGRVSFDDLKRYLRAQGADL